MKLKLGIVTICFAMLAAHPVAAQQASGTDTSVAAVIAKAQLDGKLAGEAEGGWFGRCLIVGALTGPIGAGVTWAVAANSTPELPAEHRLTIASRTPEYRLMFEQSFRQTVKKKRSITAVLGGLTGTAALVALSFSGPGGQ